MIVLKASKGYIQYAQKIEDCKNAFLNRREEEFLDYTTRRLHIVTSDLFFSTIPQPRKFEYYYFPESKNVKIVEQLDLIEPKLELEIKKASLKLRELRNDVDISEDIWNYTTTLIREISEKFWSNFGKHIPKPKIEFIDESIEIRWIRDDRKFILSITDYIEDIIVYVKTSKGQYLSHHVPKDEIEDWVLFWLKQN